MKLAAIKALVVVTFVQAVCNTSATLAQCNTWHEFGGGVTEEPFDGPPRVNAMINYRGELVIGGAFVFAGGVEVNGVARWDGTQWHPLGSGVDWRILDFCEFNGDLIAAGVFWLADGKEVNHIARWDGKQWNALGSGMNAGVFAVAVYNGELVAGGPFTLADGISAKYIARWNGIQWQSIPQGPQTPLPPLSHPFVNDLIVYNNELIVGGSFAHVNEGATQANSIARWNGTSWLTLGSGLTGSSPIAVNGLYLHNGELIVGGGFTMAGGLPANFVARWNGSTWDTFGAGVNGGVHCFALYDGQLIAGGDFTFSGADPVNRVARWNETKWTPMGSGMSLTVACLLEHNDMLVAGGQFGFVDGVFVERIASWQNCATVCPADVAPPENPDHVVNVIDLLFVLSAWGQTGTPGNLPGDLNGDGAVNVVDLLAVINAWGVCP